MDNRFLAEMLALLLVLAASFRFFLISYTRRDSLAIAPTAALVISILNILIFGFSLIEFLVFLIALLSFIWNFRSLTKMLSDVITDQYDFSLILLSIFTGFACMFAIFTVIYFKPMTLRKKNFHANETTTLYAGNFRNGLYELEKPFTCETARIIKVEPDDSLKLDKNIILFVPPKTASLEMYRPLFYKLADYGYTVYGGEFYTKDSKWFNGKYDRKIFRRYKFIHDKLNHNDEFTGNLLYNERILENEFQSLFDLASITGNDKIFLLSEDDVTGIMGKILAKNKHLLGSYDLSFIEGYDTKGFGPVENTDPLISFLMDNDIDRSGYLSSHLAKEVNDFFNTLMFPDIESE